ncbi:hypothetical protein J4E91_009565 [Alternaria rosae]|nr:hypothetical protein J4E91_009565 [Alternaria rosae]
MSGNSKAISTTLHMWAFDPVIRELQSCPAARAAEFVDLMIPGHVSILSAEGGNAVQSFAAVYGARRLHPRSLRKILEKHQSWVEEA